MQNSSFYLSFGKRIFDICFSIFLSIILSPILILIFLILKLSSKDGAFYIQKRMGKGFREFDLYKFRSMIKDADKKGLLITSSDDERITKFGRFLRSTKLDELPQIFNVLKGDMSIVGPRPEVKKYVDIKAKKYEKILSIKPGITDMSSLVYIDEEDILAKYEDKNKAYVDIILEDKIKRYNFYIDNMSFFNDIKIIFITIKKILL